MKPSALRNRWTVERRYARRAEVEAAVRLQPGDGTSMTGEPIIGRATNLSRYGCYMVVPAAARPSGSARSAGTGGVPAAARPSGSTRSGLAPPRQAFRSRPDGGSFTGTGGVPAGADFAPEQIVSVCLTVPWEWRRQAPIARMSGWARVVRVESVQAPDGASARGVALAFCRDAILLGSLGVS